MTSGDRVISWILGLWVFYILIMVFMALTGLVPWVVAVWGIGAMLLAGWPGLIPLINDRWPPNDLR